MVFSSVIFLCFFLPVVFFVNKLCPNVRVQNVLLTVFSLIFYAYGEPYFIFLLLALALLHYLAGLAVLKKGRFPKALLGFLLAADLAGLLIFKYAAFLIETVNAAVHISLPVPHIALPIGISFFTFQIMSYAIDAYRDNRLIQKNFLHLLLYISFFPQLIAGPIVRYEDIREQLTERAYDRSQAAPGFQRFITGLAKKVLISNTMATAADLMFALGTDELTMPAAFLASAAYGLQIYYDFSGYSDMAIGMAQMFGFRFQENFNYPYSALSISDFWRRWHISLTSWFRSYVYIPLGGNRKGKARTMLNILIVFLLTGIWHGANYTFIIWGLYHAFFMIAERLGVIPVDKIRFKPLKWLYTVFVAFTGFIIFRADSLSYAWAMIRSLFAFSTFDRAGLAPMLARLDPYFLFILAIAVVFSFPILPKIRERFGDLRAKTGVKLISYVVSAATLFVCLAFLITDSYNPFIYFNF